MSSILGFIATPLLLFALFSRATSPAALIASVADGDSDARSLAIERADRLYDETRFDEARRVLEALLKKHPKDAEILWRLANHAINDGDAETNETKQERLYRRSVSYAERAVKADGRNAWGHAYLAAAYGSYAMYAGGEEKVKLANRIRDELDVALKLDPENQVAHTIYGTWHREVADVSWIERKLANIFLGSMPDGSFERSVFHLRKAIDIAPDILRHRYELGLTYIAMDREKDAAAAFRGALKCPDGWKVDPIRREFMRDWLRDNG